MIICAYPVAEDFCKKLGQALKVKIGKQYKKKRLEALLHIINSAYVCKCKYYMVA